jgi:hypothetical protein
MTDQYSPQKRAALTRELNRYGEAPIPCTHCSAVRRNRETLRAHQAIAHGINDEATS